MRLTQKLYAQHIGWWFKKKWHAQGKRIAHNTGAFEELAKHGIVSKDPVDILNQDKLKSDFKFPHLENETIKYEECYNFDDNSVFVEGLQQAQIISKSIVVDDLPEDLNRKIETLQLANNINKNIHRAILSSFCLDAYQEKLPKEKVPEKPMYVLPRTYGIPANRKYELLISKLLYECEKMDDVTSKKKIINNCHMDVFLNKELSKIRLNMKADTLLLNQMPLNPVKGNFNGDLPSIFPMQFSIGLEKIKVTKNELINFNSGILASYWPHLSMSNFIPEEVKNKYGTPVNENQFKGRSLIKAFTIAYCKAKSLYGDSHKDLPKPIVVRGIHTDGKLFHFGVFQLNTLDFDESNPTKNIWFQAPEAKLFEVCEYQSGRPVLEGFNPNVFKFLNVFYQN